jgi:hypothetical protein
LKHSHIANFTTEAHSLADLKQLLFQVIAKESFPNYTRVFMLGSIFSFGIYGIIVMAMALMHFIKRRPDGYWLWVILLLGPLGALVYLVVEALPDLWDPGTFKIFPRRRRIGELQFEVLSNPSAGNYEELGQLYLDDGKWEKARDAFNRAITQRTDSADPFYRRSIAEIELGDYKAAIPDLERAIAENPGFDFHRAKGLLAYALAKTGDARAEAMFQDALRMSTLTETQYHYAEFLAEQGRTAEAKEWVQKIIRKRATMPGFLKRRERQWFYKNRMLQAKLR